MKIIRKLKDRQDNGKKKVEKDKQPSTPHYIENLRSINSKPHKNRIRTPVGYADPVPLVATVEVDRMVIWWRITFSEM